jgi:hypothetical protein|tara:strand:+ start:194 stop:412 length:219 start_codon:yes stop_codon:yes gene_type:complete
MNKSTLQDCLAMFKQYGVYAEIDDIAQEAGDETILVQTSNPDVYVQISKQEIIWRADQYIAQQYLERKEQES